MDAASSSTLQPAPDELSPQEIERRLSHAMLLAARLQLFVAIALIWLTFISSALVDGLPVLTPTLVLVVWLLATTAALGWFALRGNMDFLTGKLPGRIALLAMILTVILVTLLVHNTGSDFYLIYFFPVIVALLYYGWRIGVATALFSGFLYGLLALNMPGVPPYALLGRVVFLFALAGTIGLASEGRLALLHELERAYLELKTTTVALETTRAALSRRMEEVSTLDRVGREFTGTLDAQTVLRRVLEEVEQLLDAEAATLMRLDASTNELVFQIPLGVQGEQLQGYRLPIGQGIAGTVAQTGTLLRVDNTAQDSRHFQSVDQQSGFRTRSILCVPLKLQDRVTGVIEVMNKKSGAFTPADESLLTSVAQWAAIAVENARLYEDLQKSMAEVQRAQDHLIRTERLRALGEMAGGVAHDFNNLLTIVLAEAQLMSATPRDDRDMLALQRIEHAARDAAEAVRRLQEYTRLRRDSPRELVEVDELVFEAIEITRPRWRYVAEMELRVEPVGAVIGNPSELREVLTNLIFNAVEARVEDRPCRLTIWTGRAEGKWTIIAVEDNGTGIAPTVQQHIFDPYFTTKPHGTGLGLSVVYGIIARHGGEITVTSPVCTANASAGGTRFEIRLPIASRTPEALYSIRSSETKRFQRVLFIDDDANVLAAASNLLSSSGYTVVTGRTRQEADELLTRGEFDVLMTDLTMPEWSGWELARRAKQLFPNKPVVLVTGWGLQLDPRQLHSGLVDGILSKPFSLAEVTRVLDSLP